MKFIGCDFQPIRLQLFDHVRAELFELCRTRGSGAKLNLLANLLEGTVAIKIGSPF